MSSGPHPYFAREGWPFVLGAVLLTLVMHLFVPWMVTAPLWLLALVLLYLFRDPDRDIPAVPLAIVSPVDGCVLSIDKGQCNPYIDQESVRIRLSVSLWGAYGIRSPIEGRLMERWLQTPVKEGRPGKLAESSIARATQLAMWVQTDEKDDIVMVLMVPSRLQRPSCYVQLGQRVGQGQRCGMLRFGGGVELYLPASARLEIKTGDHVKAGSAILGTFLHK